MALTVRARLPTRTRKLCGASPWTQWAAVRTRSEAISEPLQNGRPCSSEANHGALVAGVPWKTAADARRTALSITAGQYEVRYATIAAVAALTRRGLIGAGLAGGALVHAARAGGHSTAHDHLTAHGGHANFRNGVAVDH